MKKIVRSNAKVNLGLNILEKLPNGYHSLDMIMAPIDLSDILEIEIFDEDGSLEITTNKKDIPTDERNILYKVYKAYYEKIKEPKKKIKIHLEKVIPHEAGLGGGSSNGGFFLKELNSYYKNILSLDELIELSKKIGADIPFFLVNKCARAKGIGEELEVIENNIEDYLVLIKPKFGVSARVAYENYGELSNKKNANLEKIIDGLKENNKKLVLENIENHLEQALILTDEKTKEFKKSLNLVKGRYCMSGSGSVYFTIIDSSSLKRVTNTLKQTYKDCEVFVSKFL